MRAPDLRNVPKGTASVDESFFTTPYKFRFDKITITTERGGGNQFDVQRVVSEVNIYEHLDKPFLTATMSLNDIDPNVSLSNEIHFMGTEKVSMDIRVYPGEQFKITKNFVVTEVLKSQKSNDDNEVFILHLIEDCAYVSSLMRVRRSYRDKKENIIRSLIELSGRKLLWNENKLPVGDKLTRLIVPNFTPLEAANWVKDRIHTELGFPYFLYSTICDDKIRMLDLESMLTKGRINLEIPYTYTLNSDQVPPTNADMSSPKDRDKTNIVLEAAYVINSYNVERVSDHLNMARKGYTTSKYNFIDTTFGDNLEFEYAVVDTFSKLIRDGVLDGQTKYPIYDYLAEFNNKKIHEYDTREITHFATSRQYNDFFETESYHEGRSETEHRAKVVAKALRWWLTNSSITITAPGRNFLNNGTNMTIGNIIGVEFAGNVSPNRQVRIEELRDQQKSGDYLVYTARHKFAGERYDCTMTLSKLGTPGMGRGTY